MNRSAIGLVAALALNVGFAAPQESSENTGTVIRGINYIGVSVSDLEQAVEYYASATDLRVVEESVIEGSVALDTLAGRTGVTAQAKLLRGANAQLRFMQFESPSVAATSSVQVQVHGTGIAHVCFQVADTTASYQRFLEGGASPIGEREMLPLNPRNPVVYAYARDIDGIISEVEHIDFEKVSRPKKYDYRIRHVSLASPDIDRMVAFYSVLMEEADPRRLGRPIPLSGENFDKVSGYAGTEMEMAWFQTRNLELEIVEYLSPPPTPLAMPRPIDALGYNMIVFDVSSLAAIREKLLAGGGAVVSEPESMDGGQIFFGRDPDGNLLGFQAVAADSTVSSQNFEDNGT